MDSCVPTQKALQSLSEARQDTLKLDSRQLILKSEVQKISRVLEVSGDFRVTVDQTVDQNNPLTMN